MPEEISKHAYDVEYTKISESTADDLDVDKTPGEKSKFTPSDGEQVA
jgi:hypothetical protein